MSIVVDINHEVGDTSEYTSTTTNSNDLSISAAAALGGTNFGISSLCNDTTDQSFRKDITANTSGKLRARIILDPNSMTMANNNELDFMKFSSNAGTTYIATVCLNYANGSGYRIRAGIVDDAGNTSYTSYYVITDNPHYIEIYLQRSTGSTANNGSIQLLIDGVSKETVSGKDNYDKFNQFIRTTVGAIGKDSGTSGTFYMDELIVNDDGNAIGNGLNVTTTGIYIEESIVSEQTTLAGVYVEEVNNSLNVTSTGIYVEEQLIERIVISGVGTYIETESIPSIEVGFIGIYIESIDSLLSNFTSANKRGNKDIRYGGKQ